MRLSGLFAMRYPAAPAINASAISVLFMFAGAGETSAHYGIPPPRPFPLTIHSIVFDREE